MVTLEIVVMDSSETILPDIREGFWARNPTEEVTVARSFQNRSFPAIPADEEGSVLAFPARRLAVVHLLLNVEVA